MTKDSKFSIFRFVQFLKTDIWRIRASTLSGQKSFWIRQLRIVLLALRGFNEDKCQSGRANEGVAGDHGQCDAISRYIDGIISKCFAERY